MESQIWKTHLSRIGKHHVDFVISELPDLVRLRAWREKGAYASIISMAPRRPYCMLHFKLYDMHTVWIHLYTGSPDPWCSIAQDVFLGHLTSCGPLRTSYTFEHWVKQGQVYETDDLPAAAVGPGGGGGEGRGRGRGGNVTLDKVFKYTEKRKRKPFKARFDLCVTMICFHFAYPNPKMISPSIGICL